MDTPTNVCGAIFAQKPDTANIGHEIATGNTAGVVQETIDQHMSSYGGGKVA